MATGGTISNRPGGRLTAQQLVDSIPGLDQYVFAESEQFANVASGALTLRQWVELSRRINQIFDERDDVDGVVVSSGTDTLASAGLQNRLKDRPLAELNVTRCPSGVQTGVWLWIPSNVSRVNVSRWMS